MMCKNRERDRLGNNFFWKFDHFGGEITMSVFLHLVIKTILYIQYCQLRLCQYVYQGLLCHLSGAQGLHKHIIL